MTAGAPTRAPRGAGSRPGCGSSRRRSAIAVFFVVPVAAALVLSFTDFDIYAIGEPREPALRRLWRTTRRLLRDPLFWKALRNTFYFVAGRRAAVDRGSRSARRCSSSSRLARFQGALPHGLLRAGGHHAGRGGDRLALPLPPALRPAELGARRLSGIAPDRLARRSALGDAGDHPARGVEELRLQHDHLRRRAAEHSRASSTRRRALDGAGAWQQLRHVTLPMLGADVPLRRRHHDASATSSSSPSPT